VGAKERDFADVNGCICTNILQNSHVQIGLKGTGKSECLLPHPHPSPLKVSLKSLFKTPLYPFGRMVIKTKAKSSCYPA